MATKAVGADFKRFYADKKYWPTYTYHDDVVFRINGELLSVDKDPGEALDADILTIEGGCVMLSPLYENGNEPSLETYFRRWKKEQSTTSFAIECDISVLDAVMAAVKAAGGKVLK